MAAEVVPKLLSAVVVVMFALTTLTTLVIPMALGLFGRRP